MLHLCTTLIVSLATVVSSATLERRAPCVCPLTDSDFYPLAPSSSVVGSVLRCVYPLVSRCEYDQVSSTSFGLSSIETLFNRLPTVGWVLAR